MPGLWVRDLISKVDSGMMEKKDREVLVYLQQEHAEHALEVLRSHFSVTQMASRQL